MSVSIPQASTTTENTTSVSIPQASTTTDNTTGNHTQRGTTDKTLAKTKRKTSKKSRKEVSLPTGVIALQESDDESVNVDTSGGKKKRKTIKRVKIVKEPSPEKLADTSPEGTSAVEKFLPIDYKTDYYIGMVIEETEGDGLSMKFLAKTGTHKFEWGQPDTDTVSKARILCTTNQLNIQGTGPYTISKDVHTLIDEERKRRRKEEKEELKRQKQQKRELRKEKQSKK